MFLKPFRAQLYWMSRTIAYKTELRPYTVANKMTRITTIITNHLAIPRIKDLLRKRGGSPEQEVTVEDLV
jgi:hypothetical protein